MCEWKCFRSRINKKDIKVDVCSKCHPFWTGNLRQETTGGRADKFKKKYGLANQIQLSCKNIIVINKMGKIKPHLF